MNETQQEYRVLDLSGNWSYRLDPEDRGEAEGWSVAAWGEAASRATVSLPGTLTTNGIGEMPERDGDLNRESVRSLRQRHRYVGAAWYARDVEPAEDSGDRRMILMLERVMFQSSVWVNGRFAGSQDSLSVPHRFDLSGLLRPGRNRLIVRIDNRDIQQLGIHPSAYTDETQTIWNGIIGRIELQAGSPVYPDGLRLFPEPERRRLRIRGTWHNAAGSSVTVSASASVESFGSREGQVAAFETQPGVPPYVLALNAGESADVEWFCELPETLARWDEFAPCLHELSIVAETRTERGGARESERNIYRRRFGIRSFRTSGTSFEINGRPTFLRGTLECCIFPLTGHPPTDVHSWRRLFRTVRDYGLNHVRFHSWCPPEAAFDAADELGLYLQAEGPMWMDDWNTPVGSHPEHEVYLPQEAQRIVNEYGNHPSFCLFSSGNELNGDFKLLHDMIQLLKSGDDRRLYTLTTNWDRPPDAADDLFCAQTVDGIGARGQFFLDDLTNGTMLDFREAVAKRNMPLVSHEIGQYAVYPDVEEIERYTGALRPVNLEAIRNDLERRGLLPDIRKFVFSSGMLALQLYREEIEAALRTPGLGGFQLLDLHDFPGQSTATVGILNAFWETKGLIEPEAFRAFCGPTVPLLRMPKRIYTADEDFSAAIEAAHFGPAELPNADWEWTIRDEQGERLDRGTIRAARLEQGSGLPVGSFVSSALRQVKRSERLTVAVERIDADEEAGLSAQRREAIRNEWPIWVFRAPSDEPPQNGKPPMIAAHWNHEVEHHLDAGGSVLLLYGGNPDLRHTSPGSYEPVFWSPVHFETDKPCGVWIDERHPVFADFPTRSYAEPLWKDLLDRSRSLRLDDLPDTPSLIVQVIPNFYHNRRLTNLAEFRVGTGRLLLCGFDLADESDRRPAAGQLRRGILAYMRSREFKPANSVSTAELRTLFAAK